MRLSYNSAQSTKTQYQSLTLKDARRYITDLCLTGDDKYLLDFTPSQFQREGAPKCIKQCKYASLQGFGFNPSLAEKWNPFVSHHVSDKAMGICTGNGATHVPFIPPDLDHHKGTKKTFPIFRHKVKETIELITSLSGWVISAEINPIDCSVKFFMWAKNIKRIEIGLAREKAREVRSLISDKIGEDVEVFPDNCQNIMLPLHSGKITIVADGVLAKVAHKRKLPDKYEPKKYRYHKFQQWSCAAYIEFLHAGENFCETTFFEQLDLCAKNLPDDIEEQQPATSVERLSPLNMQTPKKRASDIRSFSGGVLSSASLDDIREMPNAREKDLAFALLACRKSGYVLSVPEFLEIKERYKMFNGTWAETSLRVNRAKGILAYIAKTFDATKCKTSGKSFNVKPDDYRDIANKNFPERMKQKKCYTNHKDLRPDMTAYKSAKYVSADRNDACLYLAITDYCRTTAKLEDGGVPEDRAKEIWQCLSDKSWNQSRWAMLRDHFHKLQIVTCDYIKRTGKAYCYKAGLYNPERAAELQRVIERILRLSNVSLTNERRVPNTVPSYGRPKFQPYRTVEVVGKPPP